MIQGYPISAKLPEDLGIGERFWYWRGASGKSFIHSIYAVDSCPPLPGAVFVAVRHRNGRREALAVGRFSAMWDGTAFGLASHQIRGIQVDEIHVHLLARGESAAGLVLADLQLALSGAFAEVESGGDFEEAQMKSLVLV